MAIGVRIEPEWSSNWISSPNGWRSRSACVCEAIDQDAQRFGQNDEANANQP